MFDDTHIIQRAFQLAREGVCKDVDDIRDTLRREGYESVGPHLAPPGLARQLKQLITEAVSLQG